MPPRLTPDHVEALDAERIGERQRVLRHVRDRVRRAKGRPAGGRASRAASTPAAAACRCRQARIAVVERHHAQARADQRVDEAGGHDTSCMPRPIASRIARIAPDRRTTRLRARGRARAARCAPCAAPRARRGRGVAAGIAIQQPAPAVAIERAPRAFGLRRAGRRSPTAPPDSRPCRSGWRRLRCSRIGRVRGRGSCASDDAVASAEDRGRRHLRVVPPSTARRRGSSARKPLTSSNSATRSCPADAAPSGEPSVIT